MISKSQHLHKEYNFFSKSWRCDEVLIISHYALKNNLIYTEVLNQIKQNLMILSLFSIPIQPLIVKDDASLTQMIDLMQNIAKMKNVPGNTQLKSIYEFIKANATLVDQLVNNLQAIVDTNAELRIFLQPSSFKVQEGDLRVDYHFYRERNSKIVKMKKLQHQLKFGNLACEICDFDFKEQYGDKGINFAEVHHKIPISDSKFSFKTCIEDLAVVCSNCHRMIHRKNPWLDFDEFKKDFLSGKTAEVA